ncbi:MAG: hypothetical protein K8U57_04345 [Planctomycetes bacterium]|nr:hypothetical protein [Planctomycetota bacterium]
MANRERLQAVDVCDRIDELTRLFEEHPPRLPEAVVAGIIAAVERNGQAHGCLAVS